MGDTSGMREFLEAVYAAISPRLKKDHAAITTGTVARIEGGTTYVVLKNDTRATPLQRYCQASVGDTALVARQGTKLYMIGVLQ